MPLCLEQISVELFAGKPTKIRQIAGDLYEAPPKYRETLCEFVSKHEKSGRKISTQNKEMFLVTIGQILKKTAPGCMEALLLLPWVDARLDALEFEGVTSFELTSWKDLLFLYQLTYLLELDMAFGPSADLVLGEFEKVSSKELARLRHNAMIMAYGLKPLAMDSIVSIQEMVKKLVSDLAEYDWNNNDWVDRLSQSTKDLKHEYEEVLNQVDRMKHQFCKLRDFGFQFANTLHFDMEGIDFLKNIFSKKEELRNLFLNSLLLENANDDIQLFFEMFSKELQIDFANDYSLLNKEYKILTETPNTNCTLKEIAPRLFALLRVCTENAQFNRDDAIWGDFTTKFTRALGEGRFILPVEGQPIAKEEDSDSIDNDGDGKDIAESALEKVSQEIEFDISTGNLIDDNTSDIADEEDTPDHLLEDDVEAVSKKFGLDDCTASNIISETNNGLEEIVEEVDDVREQNKEDVDAFVITADSSSYDPVSPEILARQLVDKEQIAALYWLTKSTPLDDIPTWLAEFAYLGVNLRPEFFAAKERVSELIELATKEVNSLSDASAMLLAAATLRPALMMPSSAQSYIFNTLTDKLQQYNSKPLMERLATFVAQNTPLDETIFLHHSQIAKKQEKHSQLRAQTLSFLDQAPKKTLVYAPATFAFRQLFNRNTGELGTVLQACVQEDFTLLRSLDLETWLREQFIDSKLNQLEKTRNPRTAKAIDFKAKDAFKRQVLVALGLLERWKRFATHPTTDQSTSYVQQVFNEIIGDAKKFNKGLEGVLNFDLRPFSVFLQDNLKRLIDKYQSDETEDIFLDPLDSLELWLLNMPKFSFVKGQVELSADVINKYLDEIGQKPPVGLEEHIRSGNFALVNKYFSVFPDMEAEPCTIDPQKNNRIFFEEELDKQLSSAKAEIERINDRIEDYYLRGVIAEEKEQELRGHASDLERTLENNKFAIPEILDSLAILDQQLESSGKEQRGVLLADLEILKATASVPDYILSFFETCLEKNEISTAHEELAELQWKASNGELLALRENLGKNNNNYTAKYFKDYLPNFELDSKKLLKDSEENTHAYIKEWFRLFSIKSTYGPTFRGLLTLILRLIGFELELESKVEFRGSEGSPYFWRVIRCTATIRSPLSKWGSEARGIHYIVYTPDRKVQPSELGKFLDGKMRKGELNKSIPITLLTQATYGVNERKKLMKIGQQMNYMPLVVDTPMFNWLLGFDSQERTKALFESGLAGAPFNPYTPTVAGAVPIEMFYGREKDIESLWDPNGPCIVYGGRQLGKSALLKRVTFLYNKPEDGQFVRYEDVRSESDIEDVVLRSLKNMEIVPRSSSIKTMPEAIKQFLSKNPSSRILLLLDECDLLIKSDMQKAEMPGLSAIRGIMTDTNRHFKVVMAGLESVQRYSHMPNTPFPHYGVPLCVGPLQPMPARNLVEEPMAAIGLHFKSPELIQRVLVHTNHNPSLIQLFCHELVGAMHERTTAGESQVPREISKEIIAQVYRRANLRNQIRERFEWTLELDLRYKVTGYTLALMHEYSQGVGMGRGFKLREILSELSDYWPQAFSKASREEVSSILTEMEGLGIVLKFGDTYRLRSPNIINLLGGSNSIIDELSYYANKPYDGGKALDMRPVLSVDGETFSSPLALSQINEIKMSKRGLVLVTGSKALGLDRVGKTIQYVRKYDIPVKEIKGINSIKILSNLKNYYNTMGNSGCIAWFDSEECSDFVQIIKDIHAWLTQLRTDKKYIGVIAVVGTKDVLELFINDDIRHVMKSPFVRHLPLGKWSESGVDEWFHNQPEKLARPTSIIDNTSGWDYFVRHTLETGKLDLKDHLEKLNRNFFMPSHPVVHAIIETYQELSIPMTVREFWDFLQDNPHLKAGEKLLESVFEVLVDLGVFVQTAEEDRFVLDGLIVEFFNEESA